MYQRILTYPLVFILPLLFGFTASYLSSTDAQILVAANLPLAARSSLAFEIGWTSVYLLMGLASILVMQANVKKEEKSNALQFFYFQLLFNFFWTFYFHYLGIQLFSFFWIILLWVIILFNIIYFYRISKFSAALMVPYLLWFSYTALRNLALYLQN